MMNEECASLCFFCFYLIYEGDFNYTNTNKYTVNELYNNIIFCNYIVLLCIIVINFNNFNAAYL